jgi:hypothetical protein
MPVPTDIDDLDPAAANNSPSGSDQRSQADNYLRAHAAIIKQESQFAQELTGAVTRTKEGKLQESVSVLDFGDASGATAAANLATQASASYASSMYRQVYMPGGTYTVGVGDTSIFVRKGQSLAGDGMGASKLDASGTLSDTVPTVTLGESSGGAVDTGGQVSEVKDLHFLGSSPYGNIDTTNCAGWNIHDVMFSSPIVGVVAGGSDGLLHDCLFDEGLNGAVVTGANIKINDCNFYLGNYHITLLTGAYDTLISDCQFEYAEYTSILFATGASNLKNIQIRDCNFLHNEQFSTYIGAIRISCHGADFLVSNCTFRNLKGAGIQYDTGVGNVAVIEGCLFDGDETASIYDQSTTMQGVDASNLVATIRGCTFRNLPGQPITFGGAEASTLIVEGCDFSGNTGGSTEINITNSSGSSRVVIRNCTGDRLLVNAQSTVPVVYENNTDGLNTETVTETASTHTVGVATKSLICNRAGTITVTLPPASIWLGRELVIRTITANTVVSASSNVVPTAGGSAGTAILAATAGKWARLRSDGTNWQNESSN